MIIAAISDREVCLFIILKLQIINEEGAINIFFLKLSTVALEAVIHVP